MPTSTERPRSTSTTVLLFITLLLCSLLPNSWGFSVYPTAMARPRPGSTCSTTPRSTGNRHVTVLMSSIPAVDDDSSSSSSAVYMSSTGEDPNRPNSLRGRLRAITGFSLTAFRATMRAATGISLTALYASAFAATSAFVRETMAFLLSPFPAWFRYFLQPFLILYYAPLFILRNLTGPTGKRAREKHESFKDGFKLAVEAADKKAGGYWPVHVNNDGDIVSDNEDVDIAEGVADSMEVVMEQRSADGEKRP